MKCISLAIASLSLGSCAIGVGLIFSSLLRAESYCPDSSGSLFGRAMTGFALVESFMFIVVGVFGLIFIM